jgi:hypothetical protein
LRLMSTVVETNVSPARQASNAKQPPTVRATSATMAAVTCHPQRQYRLPARLESLRSRPRTLQQVPPPLHRPQPHATMAVKVTLRLTSTVVETNVSPVRQASYAKLLETAPVEDVQTVVARHRRRRQHRRQSQPQPPQMHQQPQ